jgi:acetoin utilization deacetylase AcuC-like enzyme
MLVYYDPFVLKHDTGQHPESTVKLLPSAERLERLDRQEFERVSWQPVSQQRLLRVHTAEYIQQVQDFAAAGGGYLDPDTVVSRESFEVALLAAGAACDAVEKVTHSGHKKAFCLIRPPGHHALADKAMGFCLFNNVAVAARVATAEFGYRRVLIVDWDVHHGNGTQDIFYQADDVAFFSMHRSDFYPHTGQAAESGSGAGAGFNRNLPIPLGTSRSQQIQLFRQQLGEFAEHCQPDLVMISAGFDGHTLDPVGSLGLETDDYRVFTEIVKKIADRYANGRIVSVLEGGYNPGVLADCITLHLETMNQNS